MRLGFILLIVGLCGRSDVAAQLPGCILAKYKRLGFVYNSSEDGLGLIIYSMEPTDAAS